jgi:hypothetical protein
MQIDGSHEALTIAGDEYEQSHTTHDFMVIEWDMRKAMIIHMIDTPIRR